MPVHGNAAKALVAALTYASLFALHYQMGRIIDAVGTLQKGIWQSRDDMTSAADAVEAAGISVIQALSQSPFSELGSRVRELETLAKFIQTFNTLPRCVDRFRSVAVNH